MEDAKDEAERTTERMWDSLQEGRRAARGSQKRSEAVGASLDPDVSPEGLGGGQDLSEEQSALLTDMEDAEGQVNNVRQKAVDANAPKGATGKVRVEILKETCGSGSRLSQVSAGLDFSLLNFLGQVTMLMLLVISVVEFVKTPFFILDLSRP